MEIALKGLIRGNAYLVAVKTGGIRKLILWYMGFSFSWDMNDLAGFG